MFTGSRPKRRARPRFTMRSYTRIQWMRTLGNFCYLFGLSFLIASMAVNALPARHALAATGGTLNCPLPPYNPSLYALQAGPP